MLWAEGSAGMGERGRFGFIINQNWGLTAKKKYGIICGTSLEKKVDS